ncbi:hypothetical protein [Burkholderia phage vB_BpP_HN03]|uniref:Uncharacterized protein n=1 Tax=Burkholderia phage vB_BpP_HN02 TaxID=3116925 RepID=A0AAX4JHV5_9CAUD|nr:hypothetical protein [Burkholderia phage vB_BpP_HN01]
MLQVLLILKLLFGCEAKTLSIQSVRWFASRATQDKEGRSPHVTEINQLEYG